MDRIMVAILIDWNDGSRDCLSSCPVSGRHLISAARIEATFTPVVGLSGSEINKWRQINMSRPISNHESHPSSNLSNLSCK